MRKLIPLLSVVALTVLCFAVYSWLGVLSLALAIGITVCTNAIFIREMSGVLPLLSLLFAGVSLLDPINSSVLSDHLLKIAFCINTGWYGTLWVIIMGHPDLSLAKKFRYFLQQVGNPIKMRNLTS